MPTLTKEKQKKGKFVMDFVKRFRNFSLRRLEDMPLSMLQQTCRHNLRADIENNMGAVHIHTWKELQKQVEMIEKSISRLPIGNKGKQWAESTTTHAPLSKFKGMNVMVIDMPMEPRKSSSSQ